MNYSFEYIDIILLAMIAGFIFLRLRGILGKRTGIEGKLSEDFKKEFNKSVVKNNINKNQIFDENAKNDFIKGAKIAYETIITDFSDNDNKLQIRSYFVNICSKNDNNKNTNRNSHNNNNCYINNMDKSV